MQCVSSLVEISLVVHFKANRSLQKNTAAEVRKCAPLTQAWSARTCFFLPFILDAYVCATKNLSALLKFTEKFAPRCEVEKYENFSVFFSALGALLKEHVVR